MMPGVLIQEQIKITVFGRPQQKGSKQPFVNKRKDGSTFAGMKDDNPKAKQWQDAVRSAAAQIYQGELLRQPCRIEIVCYFARPQSHFGSGKNADKLKPSAPMYHEQTPDWDKLARTICDGLSGIVVDDDKRFCQGETRREWTTAQERAEIIITPLEV
jgi:Holliday junction resolvase RusA-like endonuclease